MKKAAFLLITILFLLALVNKAQNKEVDSLVKAFNSAQHDSTRAYIYLSFTEYLYLSKPDTIIPLCQRSIDLCDKVLATSDLPNKRNILLAKAGCFNNMGYIYQNLGHIQTSLDYYHKGLKIQEQLNDKKGIALSFNNIGFVYQTGHDATNALEYYKKSLALREEIDDKKGIGESLNNLGFLYRSYGDPKCNLPVKDSCIKQGMYKALYFYSKSLAIKEETKDEVGIGVTLNNIGGIHRALGDYDKALDFFNKSLAIREKQNDKAGLAINLNNIGVTYKAKKDLAQAKFYSLKSLAIAKELRFPNIINQAAGSLYTVYLEEKDYKNALEMFRLITASRDSLNLKDAKAEADKKQMQYKYEKKATADSLQAVHEKELLNSKYEKEKTREYALYWGLALVLVFSIFMFNRFRITQKQKHIIELKEKETQQQKQLLELKQKEIVDSINYAHRIQKALLASDNLLNEHLKNYFVLYMPKDIVSGDFYWGIPLSNGRFALSAADSTGHGVPGAFMSLLNISFLNEAVNERHLTDPGEILNYTRKRIIESLSVESNSYKGKDGMDCSLVCFDFKNKKLQYAAANNPVWVVRNNELIELSADKMPIGKHENDTTPFATRDFALNSGDMVYILTDGYADQFGGPGGKKLKTKQLQEFLIDGSSSGLQIQKQQLSEKFLAWKGSLDQVDDVLIIGVKI